MLLICKIPHYECDLSKRSKMIRIIRTMSVHESYRLEVCEAILATAQRGDIRGAPPTNNKQSNKPARLPRSIQNIMNPMTYNTKRRSNKSSRLSDLCPTSQKGNVGRRVLGIFEHFETGDLQNHSSNLAAGIIGFRGFPEFLKMNRGIRWPEEHNSCSANEVLGLVVV